MVEVPIMMTGIVFGGGVVIVDCVVGVAPLMITAPPDDAMDICCPSSDITEPGPKVCEPITKSDDDICEMVSDPTTGGAGVVREVAVPVGSSSGPVELVVAMVVGKPGNVGNVGVIKGIVGNVGVIMGIVGNVGVIMGIVGNVGVSIGIVGNVRVLMGIVGSV